MKTLFKSTVQEFYRQRAGFFLMVGMLAFGFLSTREHRGIAIFFLTDGYGIVYLAAVWSLYTAMTVVFWNTLWKSPEYTFIYDFRLVAPSRRITGLAGLAAGFLLPVLLYGLWIICTAAGEGMASRIPAVACLALSLVVILTLWADRRLKNQDTSVAPKAVPVARSMKRPSSLVFWRLEWLFREKALTLLLSKAGAALFIISTLLYYGTDDYDLRLPAVGLTLAVLANIGISYEIYRWETGLWLWGRSLPIPFYRRAAGIVLTHFLILLPDFLLAARYGHPLLTAGELVRLVVLQLGFILWYHGTLYRREKLPEDSLATVFPVFIGVTLLILYRVPPEAIAAAMAVSGAGNYYRWVKS